MSPFPPSAFVACSGTASAVYGYFMKLLYSTRSHEMSVIHVEIAASRSNVAAVLFVGFQRNQFPFEDNCNRAVGFC
jgi:hypothetical protein